MGTAMIVEIKPVTAAAIPAMCPGSMAMARKFPKGNTKELQCKKQQQNIWISSVIK
jgi:hypothetical protein